MADHRTEGRVLIAAVRELRILDTLAAVAVETPEHEHSEGAHARCPDQAVWMILHKVVHRVEGQKRVHHVADALRVGAETRVVEDQRLDEVAAPNSYGDGFLRAT